ncbi:MAG: tail fiber domain-containing protein [Proteobacteria bacterium]|nr:tail fiber domain-containing protein [Pseudomonadota bacterium]
MKYQWNLLVAIILQFFLFDFLRNPETVKGQGSIRHNQVSLNWTKTNKEREMKENADIVRQIENMEREIARLKRVVKTDDPSHLGKFKRFLKKRWLVPLVVLTGLGAVGLAMAAEIPHTFGTGGVISATRFNENFAYIVDRLWGKSSSDLYYNSGNVGIGTSSPLSPLHVNKGGTQSTWTGVEQWGLIVSDTSSSGSKARIGIYGGSTGTPELNFGDMDAGDEDAGGFRYSNSVDSMTLRTNDADRVTVDNAGNVGIGTTDPSADLHLHNDNNTTQFKIYSGGGYHDSYTVHGLFDENAYWMTGVDDNDNKYVIAYSTVDPAGEMPTAFLNIQTNGSVGIGMMSSNSDYKLAVAGWAYTTGTWDTSDVRWKKNIDPLKNSLDKVTRLNGVSFEWDLDHYPEKGFKEGRQIGLIAQEIEKVVPELVRTDEEGYKSVSYGKLSAILVEALKELKGDNDALRSKNDALEERLARLETFLNVEQ